MDGGGVDEFFSKCRKCWWQVGEEKKGSRDDFVTKRIELVNALNSLNSYVDSANRRFGVFFRCVFFFGQIEAMELSNVTKHDMC